MSWRSILFTPADRPERVSKAIANGLADVVVADLEDAVAPANKQQGREGAVAALQTTGPARRAVRINPWPSTAAEDDLAAVLPGRPDLILVPKAEDPAAIAALAERIGDNGVGLVLILETAAGVLAAQDLAACDGVVAIAFGAEDLAADVGMIRSAENWEVQVPRANIALAAAAAGCHSIDMITADFSDLQRLEREAKEAQSLGYAGKMCIHPKQCEIVHAAFAPTPEQIEWATRIMAAVEASDVASGGVVVVDGKMIDVPLIEQARRILR